jgi:hypothetical protein
MDRGEWWRAVSEADSGSYQDFSDALYGSDTQIINAKAKPYFVSGDGTTDDAPAIQNLFDSLSANTAVYFPQGSYRISSQITLPALPAIKIFGAGPELTIFIAKGAAFSTMFFKGDSETIHYALEGFTVNCNDLADKGIVFEASRQGRFIDLKLFRYLDTGFELGKVSATNQTAVNFIRDLRIDGNSTTPPDYGLRLFASATDNIIDSCYATNNAVYGFSDAGGQNSYTNCHVFGSGPTACFRPGASARLINCMADTPDVAGIELGGDNISIIGCRLFANTGDASYNPAAVGIKATSAYNIAVIGCRFTDLDKEYDIVSVDSPGLFWGNTSESIASAVALLNFTTENVTLDGTLLSEDKVLTIRGQDGQRSQFQLNTGANARWTVLRTNQSEAGSDAGSNFQINRFSDAGAFLGTPITINRATGKTDILESLEVTGDLGFYGTPPISKPTVTGSRGGNAALASLLTELANLGLITDSTT